MGARTRKAGRAGHGSAASGCVGAPREETCVIATPWIPYWEEWLMAHAMIARTRGLVPVPGSRSGVQAAIPHASALIRWEVRSARAVRTGRCHEVGRSLA